MSNHGNRNVQKVKEEVQKKREGNIKTTRGLDTEAVFKLKRSFIANTFSKKTTQWTGENRLALRK
jgi:hypothetical protein